MAEEYPVVLDARDLVAGFESEEAEPTVPEEEMRRLRQRIRSGNERIAPDVISANSTIALRNTFEHEKLRTGIAMQIALQERLANALGTYMEIAGNIAEQIRQKALAGELADMTPKELIQVGERLKKILEPAVDLATLAVKRDPKEELPMGTSVTARTVNIIYAMAHRARG